MTHEQFVALVGRLENYAEQNPEGYKLRVGLLAAGGYAYIFFVLGALGVVLWLLVSLSLYYRVNALVFKLSWILLVFAYVIVRALWVRLPEPEGIEISRDDHAPLHALIEEVARKLDAPRPHRVLLTDEFNAAIVQRPRLGAFGWQQNYLIVGLPLLHAVSPDQFRTVLAHELGHLSGNHGRFASWIYRVRVTWLNLLASLTHSQHWGVFIFERFFNRYAPFFNAYSFVLARSHEYTADQCAVQVAGTKHAAEALINLEVKDRQLSRRFWKDVFKRAETQDAPPTNVYASLPDELRQTPDDAARFLHEAMLTKTDYNDTHPSLADRLRALGHSEAVDAESFSSNQILPNVETAAERYIPDYEKYTESLDRLWREAISVEWQERYRYARKSREEVNQIEEKLARGDELTDEERWNRVRFVADFEGLEAARPILDKMYAEEPDSARVSYALGATLLESGDDAGIALVEKAMNADKKTIIDGCESIYLYLKQRGRLDEAAGYEKRLREQYVTVDQAQFERSAVTENDIFLAHGLPADKIRELCARLKSETEVRRAFLVRKQVEHFPELPLYVLAVEPRKVFYKFRSDAEDQALFKRLAETVEFDGALYIIVNNSHNWKVLRAISNVESSVIYED